MPKIKTHKATKKRIRRTKNGKGEVLMAQKVTRGKKAKRRAKNKFNKIEALSKPNRTMIKRRMAGI